PIQPRGERRIEIEYTQALTAENGLVRYVYPLNTEKFSALPLENVSVSVDIRSGQPIRAAYSPSHPVSISRQSSTHFRAGYEDSNVTPDADFALYYSIGAAEAFHVLSYRDPNDPYDSDGFFLLMLAPRPDIDPQPLPKDVLLVLDKSGSMEGEKFRQAQQALRYVLKHLNTEDRFNIITFSTGLETYASRLRPASEAAEAIRWVDRLAALGSTDINRALLEAAQMTDPERPTYIIFLTDGLPTEGVTDSQLILDNLELSAPRNLRLFSFGLGYDVDTFLLDSLSQAHHGASTYVRPGEHLDEILSAFYEKVSTPVLTDLELDFGDLQVYDIYPYPLPDMFSGSQIVITGRYRSGGTTTITLRGKIGSQTQTFSYEDQSFASRLPLKSNASVETLPRLWATRKIGHLLNTIRLRGPDKETIDQIVRLSIRYGIVTPYTSYLVTEPMPLGQVEQDRIAEEAFDDLEAAPSAPAYGQAAVEKAAEQGDLAAAASAPEISEQAGDLIRIVGAHTFVYSNGIWVDTAYNPDSMDTTQINFLSDDYFALAGARPELAAAFALGPHVIAVADGIAYQVVSADAPADVIEIPAPRETSGQEDGNPKITAANPRRSGSQDTPGGCAAAPIVLIMLPMALAAVRRRKR
ncbi:MAG: VWA domain-containing protein, partial [Anaerolineae bacterium]|nr:VWA domain-containing protein [Anaerolineae bacterium]